jgi:hypothetical protein
MAYSESDKNFSAMAAGSHRDHAPVSVELRRNCRLNETDDCEAGGESKEAHTIANHWVFSSF